MVYLNEIFFRETQYYVGTLLFHVFQNQLSVSLLYLLN